MSTIDANNLAQFRNSVLDLAKTELSNLDDTVIWHLEDIIDEHITDTVIDIDSYVDDYDEDWTRDEDIVNTLEEAVKDLATALGEDDEFIHESVDSSSTIIYTAEYRDFFFENTEECTEALEASFGLADCKDIDDAIQLSVYAVLCNRLREDFESLIDWLEELDVIDAL